MYKITVPSLILWGEHDGKVPVGLAQDAYDSLGTPASQKEIFIFSESAHSPNIEENSLFNEKVNEFVLKNIY